LAIVKESGINRELYTKLPMVPVSKESNMMVEYAQSLLTNITEMGHCYNYRYSRKDELPSRDT
jgi:hypothetical protein